VPVHRRAEQATRRLGEVVLISEIEAALAPLVGMRVWDAARAVDLDMFQLGERRLVTSKFGPRKGETREVGTYALHVQCAWRICGAHGIVVSEAEPIERIAAWLEPQTCVVERVTGDAAGGFSLALAGGFSLDVIPDRRRDEQWRLVHVSGHVVFVDGRVESV